MTQLFHCCAVTWDGFLPEQSKLHVLFAQRGPERVDFGLHHLGSCLEFAQFGAQRLGDTGAQPCLGQFGPSLQDAVVEPVAL